VGNTELFSQTLTILDHPSDPMVIHFEVSFTPGFAALGYTLEHFRQATRRLLARSERLRSAMVCEVSAFRFEAEAAHQVERLTDGIWSANELPLAEFRQLSIPFEKAPLFRFRYEPGKSFQVAGHHSLIDGFGCRDLIVELLRELHPPQDSGAPELPAPPRHPLLFRVLRRCVLILDYFRQSLEIGFHPTSLLGPARPAPNQRHVFAKGQLSIPELQKLRAALNAGGGRYTLNDVILSAFHQALAQTISRKSPAGRVSTTVPFNTRFRFPDHPLFANRMGYVSISTLPGHRASPGGALARVHGQMAKAKRYQLEDTVEVIMHFFERLGLLGLARKNWLKTRTPSRFLVADTFFWKNLDTALVTNLGKIPAPEPYSRWVAEMYGFAPVVSPTVGLAILGFGDRIFLGLRAGDSVLDEREASRLLDRLTERLRPPRAGEAQPAP
jgi:hypothetical protein